MKWLRQEKYAEKSLFDRIDFIQKSIESWLLQQ